MKNIQDKANKETKAFLQKLKGGGSWRKKSHKTHSYNCIEGIYFLAAACGIFTNTIFNSYKNTTV
jgi:hypothetical protein